MIEGLDKLLKDLDKLPKEVVDDIDKTTYAHAITIERNAISKAPINLGKLRQSSVVAKIPNSKSIEYSIAFLSDYAAYMEFGTGGKVKVPPEMRKLASQFRGGGGSFEKGLDDIRAWCRNKGIDEKAAWPIFMSILKNGLKPRPFLYPALINQTRPYIADLEAVMQKNLDKI